MWYSPLALQRVEGEQSEKLEQHSTEKHRKIAEVVEHMTSKHEVVGLNPGSETSFISNLYAHFLNVSFASFMPPHLTPLGH